MPIPRSNIKSITIQNFKFFQSPETFELNDNNLLLYGENGSGKSSVYWALYTLLECANKEEDDEIKKYFDPTNEEKLTNIFLEQGNPDWVDSKIKIELQDNSIFEVSLTNPNIKTNTDAQSANYSSEFLNYKMLFRLHDFAHSEYIDIFRYFEREVFPYVKFTPVNYWTKNEDGTPLAQKQTENAKQILDFVKNGPPKSGTMKNDNTKPRYPLKREADYGVYNNIINGFKNDVESLLTFINTEGNPILTDVDKFGYNFTFKLELKEEKPFKLSELQFTPPSFSIILSIPTFEGKSGVVKPHTFLNEARLSALGLAIRFAILKRRLQDSKLKLAILDDFMISLDMKNRDVALDYILDRIAPDYQLLILSHDRFMFELTKDKIARKNQTNWSFYQMFEDHDNPKTKIFPKVILDEGKVKKAKALFKAKDFASSANMIRQATEKFCKAYLTNQEQLDNNYKPMKLDGWITKVIAKGQAATPPINAQLLQDLKDYKDRIMNPNSHYDIETPLFSNELEKAIKTLEDLQTITGIQL